MVDLLGMSDEYKVQVFLGLGLLCLSGIVIPSSVWFVKSIFGLKGAMISVKAELDKHRTEVDLEMQRLETEIVGIQQNCARHQNWMSGMQQTVTKIDKNVAKICMKMNIENEDD